VRDTAQFSLSITVDVSRGGCYVIGGDFKSNRASEMAGLLEQTLFAANNQAISTVRSETSLT